MRTAELAQSLSAASLRAILGSNSEAWSNPWAAQRLPIFGIASSLRPGDGVRREPVTALALCRFVRFHGGDVRLRRKRVSLALHAGRSQARDRVKDPPSRGRGRSRCAGERHPVAHARGRVHGRRLERGGRSGHDRRRPERNRIRLRLGHHLAFAATLVAALFVPRAGWGAIAILSGLTSRASDSLAMLRCRPARRSFAPRQPRPASPRGRSMARRTCPLHPVRDAYAAKYLRAESVSAMTTVFLHGPFRRRRGRPDRDRQHRADQRPGSLRR